MIQRPKLSNTKQLSLFTDDNLEKPVINKSCSFFGEMRDVQKIQPIFIVKPCSSKIWLDVDRAELILSGKMTVWKHKYGQYVQTQDDPRKSISRLSGVALTLEYNVVLFFSTYVLKYTFCILRLPSMRNNVLEERFVCGHKSWECLIINFNRSESRLSKQWRQKWIIFV